MTAGIDAGRRATDLAERIAVLERSNEELSEFAGVVAHDLLEPLTAVIGYLQLFQRRHSADASPPAAELVGIALEGAEAMRTLVEELLEYTRSDGQTERTLVHTDALLSRVTDGLSAAVASSGGVIVADSLPDVMGDAVQLGRLFQNLLSNALKFHAPGVAPLVRVSATAEPDGWRFSVSDNGIGVDPASRERIFGMFRRLHPRNAYPGSGMGLAVCRKIVANHCGRIWAEATPGGGTTICFFLPEVAP